MACPSDDHVRRFLVLHHPSLHHLPENLPRHDPSRNTLPVPGLYPNGLRHDRQRYLSDGTRIRSQHPRHWSRFMVDRFRSVFSSVLVVTAVLTTSNLYLAMSIITSFGVPCVIFSAHRVSAQSFTAAWLLPLVPPSTVAATGTSICKLLLLQQRYSYAFVVLITSYVILGVALCTAIGIMVSHPLEMHHFCQALTQVILSPLGALPSEVATVSTPPSRGHRFSAVTRRGRGSRRLRFVGSCTIPSSRLQARSRNS